MVMIIAEVGINHNGEISLAKELVDVAKDVGADAVKFQTFNNITHLKNYELSYSEFVKLKKYCDKKQIIFLSTPHTFEAIHFLDELGISMFKVASTYLGLPNFLMEIASKGKPVMLSTGSLIHTDGMATNEEIMHALRYLDKSQKVILLHCVSKYPCKEPHYERINELKSLCANVGLSDHSKTIEIPKVPYIEKHLMLDGVECIDELVSLIPSDFKKMVRYVNGTS